VNNPFPKNIEILAIVMVLSDSYIATMLGNVRQTGQVNQYGLIRQGFRKDYYPLSAAARTLWGLISVGEAKGSSRGGEISPNCGLPEWKGIDVLL
jgi:hypothetical protein